MGYRVSLHLLAAAWNLLLAVWAFPLRKTDKMFAALVPVCLFAGLFSGAWGFGLIFESELMMRLTWLGVYWPAAILIFAREVGEKPLSSVSARMVWISATLLFLGGISPLGLDHIVSYSPTLIASYGAADPFLRMALLILMLCTVYTAIQSASPQYKEAGLLQRIFGAGFILYGLGGALSSCIMPLLGNYRLMEATSYGSVLWTSFAVWLVMLSLGRRNQILTELDQYKRNLINHVTHEFRTPLNVIQSSIDRLRMSDMDQRVTKEYFSIIDGSAERLGHFIDDLLDLAAAQQSKLTLIRESVDIKDVIEETFDSLRPLADQNQTKLKAELSSRMCYVDKLRISQVLNNLVSNAIKATVNGTVTVECHGDSVENTISVRDSGVGIVASDLSRVFESFYRAQSSSHSVKGSGLGLAVAKAWVEKHGGRIWVDSEGLGKGATVTFTLPQL